MTNMKIEAKIHWFDKSSQEGMVRLADGSLVFVNTQFTHDPDTNFDDGQVVSIHIVEDVTFKQAIILE